MPEITTSSTTTPNCGNVQCESGDKHDSCMSGSADHQAVLEEVRRTVLEEVDAKPGDKMKDLWSRGNKMLKQIEQENQQQTAKLLDEFAQRREKQEALKAEQEHLRTLLT